ncbi:Na+/H+ antiporter NhaC family protein [Haloarcula sebkhae]|uniref:Na+/H+ antiporter NhaC family protein n=2 Tax=Haloarcula sebkhae TaxID=932660 RepID=A0ACC6VNS9_9EURY|nr:Na+/H+ antiporter NhaC family protein [Haloarcula sebkhae]GGK61046.1 sodium:proton antiporter [Haloarcula sebkhae]
MSDTDSGDGTEIEEISGPDVEAIEFYGGRWMSVVPIGVFILWAIVQSGLFGIGDTTGLVAGMLVALIVGMFFAKGDWKNYANTIFDGMTKRVAATAVVAWLWAGMFSNTLQAGGFVGGLVWAANAADVGGALFPVATFILAALFTTGIGTGYGATVAFSALFFPAGILLGANPVLLFGAILSGAVFGDNLAPVSDTTIVSAVTQDADIGGVVASRFKYAVIAAVLSLAAYVFAGNAMGGLNISQQAQNLFVQNSEPAGLLHLVSMLVVIVTAVMGRHIVEAVSWGLIVAVVFNVVFDLAPLSRVLLFKVPKTSAAASWAGSLPIAEVVAAKNAGVTGSIYNGAAGFFPLIVLVLLIVAGSEIMIRGGGFEAIQEWLLENVATGVRKAETTMVVGTALVNSMITINTAAEIAIAPYIARIGQRYNINSYRRANILDANTSALGYIFPWGGGVLIGFATLQRLPQQYGWFTDAMVVQPVQVWPYVFHGWFLFGVFLLSALTGFGLEYTTDRKSKDVTRL